MYHGVHTTMNKQYNIGFTAGSFDLCHAGHILMFKDCKEICNHLIVALHDDPSSEKDLEYRMKTGSKPKNTPIMSIEERRIVLQGIKYIDEIVEYNTEADLYNLLKTLKFDVRIIGSDWKGKPYTGHDLPHTPYFHNRNHTYSSSELRKRVYEAEKAKIEAEQKGFLSRIFGK